MGLDKRRSNCYTVSYNALMGTVGFAKSLKRKVPRLRALDD